MRFVSRKINGYTAYAVSGTNTVSFAIDFDDADTKGLLGFAVERADPAENQRYYMYGYKVFKELVPNPTPNMSVSTFDHPVQSFVWDDFTAEPGRTYEYFFHPLKGSPQHINRSAPPLKITVQTEPLVSNGKHDVFFNRGVASSQAFARRFHNVDPSTVSDPAEAKAIFDWLARDLGTAIIRFIDQAQSGDTLLACMYEFHYQPVVDQFKAAIDRGVKVHIIIDAKDNELDFPRNDNLQALQKAGIPKKNIIERRANKNAIQHNKFIVYERGAVNKPTAVWTGSTNISEGGIFGQTNVGHWVRDAKTAEQYVRYWQLLSLDPGAKPNGSRSENLRDNAAFKGNVVALQKDIEATTVAGVPSGITPIFSPRTSAAMLAAYADLLNSAKTYAAITLAFGISDVFKSILQQHTAKSPITFLLLEQKDAPRPNSKDTFVRLTAKNNVYEAWGSYIQDPLYQWTKEANTKLLKLNQHVMYIHSKFLLVDPLGAEPLIVTGSANFSQASTTSNDENMIIIKGDTRVADIYFTEFNRLFNHYYFRSVYESLHSQKSGQAAHADTDANLFLAPDDNWLERYQPGKIRYKRVKFFADGLVVPKK